MNNWKNKFKTGGDNFVFKKVGRPNLLEDNLIIKVKDIAIVKRQAGGVINRRKIVNRFIYLFIITCTLFIVDNH